MLLLGAALSDTVILASPTTTDRDVAVVEYLERVLELDGRDFGQQMFQAGQTCRASRPRISFGAMPRLTSPAMARRSWSPRSRLSARACSSVGDELLAAMQHERAAHGVEVYALMVTDIVDKGTELLIAGDIAAAARAFGVEPSNGGSSLTLPGVMSRKKQVAPKLLAGL